MQLTEFPSCCGADVVHDFSRLKSNAESMRTLIRQDHEHGIVLAITAHEQTGFIAALRANKFKPILKWRNSNTGNRLTLWSQGGTAVAGAAKAATKVPGRRKPLVNRFNSL